MLAAVRDRYGTTDVVRLEELTQPVPADDQVLVSVKAASVNRGDLDALGPKPAFVRLFIGMRRPRNTGLGLDVAGVVDAVGPAVTRFKPGDQVFGDMYPYGVGSFAEFVCAPERGFQLVPGELSLEDASTLPHAATLGIQGLRLRDGRSVGRGDKVAIVGASGSVGPFAVQIAKSRGAEVTGVCSAAKMDLVRALGADHVIDYTTTDYTKTGERYDWIVDTDSHHSTLAVRRALRPGGVYVTLGGSALRILEALLVGPVVAKATGKRHMGLLIWWKPFFADDVAALTELVASGKVKPVIERRYPLTAIVDALRHVEAGRARGKVVVTP